MTGASGSDTTTRRAAVRGGALSRFLPELSWVSVPLGIGVVSRLVSIVVVLFASAAHRVGHMPPRLIPSANPLTQWDGQWYISIAERGYHAVPLQPGPIGGHHDVAFFPGWPALIRLASLGFLHETVVAVVLANLLAVAALVVIWRVLVRPFGPEAATNAVTLLAFSPASFVLSMAYSEPLFLFVTGLAFLAAAYPGRRAILGGLAMLVRVSAVALLAASAVRALQTRGRLRQAALWTIAGGAVGLGAWVVGVAYITHDPLGFLHHGSASWALVSGWRAIVLALEHPNLTVVTHVGVWALLLVGAFIALRRSLELGTYAIVAIGLAVLPGGFVESMPRYALVAFPAFAGLSSVLGRRGTALLLAVFIVLQAYFALGAFGMRWLYAP